MQGLIPKTKKPAKYCYEHVIQKSFKKRVKKAKEIEVWSSFTPINNNLQ